MKLSTLLLPALASTAVATPVVVRRQDPSCPHWDYIPVCGLTCIVIAVLDAGCAVDDYACMCANFETIRFNSISCILTNCGMQGLMDVINAVNAVCENCVAPS